MSNNDDEEDVIARRSKKQKKSFSCSLRFSSSLVLSLTRIYGEKNTKLLVIPHRRKKIGYIVSHNQITDVATVDLFTDIIVL